MTTTVAAMPMTRHWRSFDHARRSMESWPLGGWPGSLCDSLIVSEVTGSDSAWQNLAHQQHLIMMSMSPNLRYCEDSL
jgi:hypothetical protein